MLDRLLKLIVVLTLLFFLIQAVIGVLARALESALRGIGTALGVFAGLVSQFLVWLALLGFLVGLLVRGIQFIANRGPRAARERAARDRAIRQRVRRPAEGVPPVGDRQGQVRDPDPALNGGREDG